ncbi:beta-1,3-galactosyltransferase 1-like isoform 1-T2 [Odontesthes bonariensis]|uniref:beta-1,3-galactosyltransferase 1 n=1 Tax=Odontesthes bonariensis TaxID=219752 RepID=UPI003F58E168
MIAERLGCCSRRHCLLFILAIAAVFFFHYLNILEMGPNWNPKLWMQNHSTKLFMPFGGQSTVKPTGESSTSAERSSPTRGTTTPNATTAASTQTARAPPVPYVSPGPYVVEYPYEYSFTINEPHKCEPEQPFVILMVQVAPNNRAHRDVIRSTWGAEGLVAGKVVKLVFLLGRKTGDGAEQLQEQLRQESAEHHDLIQSDFIDCYKNLTIKSMVMLEWLDTFCPGTSYAMKIDSDMFLNVPNLVDMLLRAPKTNYMTGLVAYGGPVLRDKGSKWYLPAEIFSPSVYPPYALGLGYILSVDLPKKLIGASRHVRALYIEDVYLGLCMQYLGINPTNPPSGNHFHVIPLSYNRCTFSQIVATTLVPDVDRMWLWKDFKRTDPYC